MTYKKRYIKPQVDFEQMESTTGFCDEFTGSAPGKPVHGEDRPSASAKTSEFFCLDDMFEGPIEEANEEFQYTLDF